MSSPPTGPGASPDFTPPVNDGGYGGSLQDYGQQRYPAAGYGAPGVPSTPLREQLPSPFPWTGPPPLAGPPAPNPYAAGPHPATTGRPPQRPAGIALAVTLAATASLQWIGVLSFCWLVATAGADQLGTSGVDGGIYHLLNRFNYRMLDGLAWPLYLFPLASFVLSFLLVTRRPWARLAFTATGAAAVLWTAWWLRSDLIWWLVPAGYIAVTVLVLWTAEATQWYRWRPPSDAAGQPH